MKMTSQHNKLGKSHHNAENSIIYSKMHTAKYSNAPCMCQTGE